MIQITEEAAEYIKEVMKEKNSPYIRILFGGIG